MELLLQLTEKKEGIMSEEKMTIPQHTLFALTPQKLWHYYTQVLERVEKRHKEFKEKQQK